jgi:hypothetical protein
MGEKPSPAGDKIWPPPAAKVTPTSVATGAPALPAKLSPPVAEKVSPPSQARPLFDPPPAPRSMPATIASPSAPSTQSPTRAQEIRPVSASVEAVRVDVTDMWAQQLARGTIADQVRALRELAKFKNASAHHVPQIAELLVKGDVTVRREVPLTLQSIGPSARIATALLERALNDQDTEVKVNAARCLVEFSAK